MKKTQLIELLNIIKSSAVSFIAIFMFVALGVGIYTGIGWSGKAFEKSLNSDYDVYKLKDVEIAFPYGMDKDDIKKIKAIDDVEDVEGCYLAYQFFNNKGIKTHAKLIMMTDEMDQYSQVEGKLPAKSGEIAVEKYWADRNGIKVGDTIKFTHDDDGESHFLSNLLTRDYDNLDDSDKACGMKLLNDDTFKVTALCESAAYPSVFPVTYGSSSTTSTQVNCLMFLNEASFDKQAYTGYNYLFVRSKNLRGYDTYSDAYKDKSVQFRNEVEKVTDKIAEDKCQEIHAAGDDSLADAQSKLDDANRKINKGKKAIKKGEAQIKKYEKLLPANQLKSYRNSIKKEKAKLSDARSDYNDGVNSKNDLADALDDIKDYGATVLIRDNNAGVSMSTVVADMYEKLKLNMASLFVLIGLLVCYSAVSRIVYNHSKQIGTKKALGFTKRQIRRTYLYYAGFAAVSGTAVGLLMGRFVIERIFINVLKQNYLFVSTEYFFSAKEAIGLAALEIVLNLLAAFLACNKMLKSNSVDLLTGNVLVKSKVRWYEKSKLWERQSVLKKAIINNFSKDFRRVLAMLIGIAGCTALVVCAISYNDIITGSFSRHYDKIQSFDSIIYFDTDKSECRGEIEELLKDEKLTYTPAYTTVGALKTPEDTSTLSFLFAFEDKDMNDLLRLYSLDGQKEEMKDKIWINCSYPEYYDLDVGDKVTFVDPETQEYNLKIGGSYEFYLQRCQLVMSQSTYKKSFGKEATSNAFVVRAGDNYNKVVSKLRKIDGYILADDFYGASKQSFDVVGNISKAVVGVYLVLAVIMALLIILNLLTMYVEEKKRELITLRINGYSVKYARRYIYSDTILVTIVGILIGIVIGIIMGKWNADSITSFTIYFIKDIDIFACIVGAVTTTILTVIMSLISLRRVNRLKLSDLNRE